MQSAIKEQQYDVIGSGGDELTYFGYSVSGKKKTSRGEKVSLTTVEDAMSRLKIHIDLLQKQINFEKRFGSLPNFNVNWTNGVFLADILNNVNKRHPRQVMNETLAFGVVESPLSPVTYLHLMRMQRRQLAHLKNFHRQQLKLLSILRQLRKEELSDGQVLYNKKREEEQPIKENLMIVLREMQKKATHLQTLLKDDMLAANNGSDNFIDGTMKTFV
jgi:hypothetical protein